MGDNSDKLSIIPEMLRLWREGATVVCPSRYTTGGRQHGGGMLKSDLSRLAGRSLGWCGFPTSDPTNNFKLYDAEWLQRQTIESRGGFEIALELCYKAFVQGRMVRELPTEWRDREIGASGFRLAAWLPHYLRWYLRSVAALLGAGLRRALDPAPTDRKTILGILLLVVLVLFLRRPDAFLNPQLWAEDGTVFLSDQQLYGASALWRTHLGYHLLVPRLVAAAGAGVGILFTPALYNLASLAALVFVARYLLSSRIGTPYKGLMALALVLCPHRGEVFMNLANAQWVLSLALLLLVISEEPERRSQRAFDVAVLVLVGLTGPFAFLFLPLFLARLALRRTSWSACLAALAGGLAAIQLLGIAVARNEGLFDPGDPTWLALVGRSLAGLLLIGDMPIAPPSDAVLVAVSVALYGLFAVHCLVQRSATPALLLGGGLAILASAAYAYRGNPQELVDAIGVRYWYVPIVTLLWAASICLRSRRPIALASAAIWILALGSTLSMFAAPPYTDYQWAASVACARQRGLCTVPINPPGWSFSLWSDRPAR
jgi:hypothetical protein